MNGKASLWKAASLGHARRCRGLVSGFHCCSGWQWLQCGMVSVGSCTSPPQLSPVHWQWPPDAGAWTSRKGHSATTCGCAGPYVPLLHPPWKPIPFPGWCPCKSHLRGARRVENTSTSPGQRVSVEQYMSTARPAGPQHLQSKAIALLLTAA